MSRLKACFKKLGENQKKALIPFITAGDPNADFTLSCMHTMVEAGADIIELGIPFSDPMADGPVIQQASERALAAGMSLKGVLAIVEKFRQKNVLTPIVLMGYLNPIEFMGYENFAKKAAKVGVDGVLTVDMPPEESEDLCKAYKKHEISPIYLLSPTSHQERIKKITQVASGYIYYVSLKGVTGSGNLELTSVSDKLDQIKQYTALPIAVGFGVKNAKTASDIARIGDAVVVGSALIERINENTKDPEKAKQAVSGLLNSMRLAMDTATIELNNEVSS